MNNLIFFILTLFISVNCNSKTFCLTNGEDNSRCPSSSYDVVFFDYKNMSENIQANLDESDTNVTIILFGTDQYYIIENLSLNIFNNKIVTIINKNYVNLKINVTDVHNVNFTAQNKGNVFYTELVGSNLNDDQTSFTFYRVRIINSVNEIQIGYFAPLDSSQHISSSDDSTTILKANTVYYSSSNNFYAALNDTFAVVENFECGIRNENINLILQINGRKDISFTNNITKSSIKASINVLDADYLYLNGNDFYESVTFSISSLNSLRCYVGKVFISSFEKINKKFDLFVNQSLTIKGKFPSNNTIFEIDIIDYPSERLSINLDSLSIGNGYIQILNSWIDLSINQLSFNSEQIPVVSCIGYGGSSRTTIENVYYTGQSSLLFNSVEFESDLSKTPNDDSIKRLIENEWEVFKIKSCQLDVTSIPDFKSVIFKFSIHGFDDDLWRILHARSTFSNDYVVIINTSSYANFPFKICYKENYCTDSSYLSDITKLADIIPENYKVINFTNGPDYTDLDLTGIKTKNAIFTIVKGSAPLQSIKTLNYSDDSNIEHLVFDSTEIAMGKYYLNSKKITFLNSCTRNYEPIIYFDERSEVNTSFNSLKALNDLVDGKYPLTNVYDAKFSELFMITNNSYKQDMYLNIPRLKFPNVIFNYEIAPEIYEDNDVTKRFNISIENPIIESITFKFKRKEGTNIDFYVNLHNLNIIESVKKIHLDFGNCNNYNIVDLNNFPRKDFLQITGSFVKVINVGYDSKSRFCVCKGDSCNQCSKDHAQLSYEDFCQKIHDDSDSKIEILIVGSGDNNLPVLNLDLISNKDVSIVGVGQNPTIQIDCSKSFSGETNDLIFKNIKIVPISGDNLQVSNLNLDTSCTFDSSFNTVSLKVDTLICNTSNLVFKSIFVYNYLTLYGDVASSPSSTKVSFGEFSRFNIKLPSTITFNGPKLVFNKLEFDLSNTAPNFETEDEITIIGQNGNIESISKNITFVNISQLKIQGTWMNVKHSKFFYLMYDKNVSLTFNSENIPIVVDYPYSSRSYHVLNISLESEKVSLFGDFLICLDKWPQINIKSIYNGRTSFRIERIYYRGENSYYSPHINLTSSNIDMIVENIETRGYNGKPIVTFNVFVDLNGYDTVKIANKVEARWYQPSMYLTDYYENPLSYNIRLNVHSYPNDPKVIEFFNNNYTLITSYDEIPTNRKALSINTNMWNVFSDEFLNSAAYYSSVVLECIGFPFGDTFELQYSDYTYTTVITEDDFDYLEKFIPPQTKKLFIHFSKALTKNAALNFRKVDFTIQEVEIDTNEYEPIPIKFGTSISNLILETVEINIIDDDFYIPNVILKEGSKISGSFNENCFHNYTLDFGSFLSSELSEYNNNLTLIIDPSDGYNYEVTYIPSGLEVLRKYGSSSKKCSIDALKFPKMTIILFNKVLINAGYISTELIQFNRVIVNSSLIYIGKGWSYLPSSIHINYELAMIYDDMRIITSSFPFESWDLMYQIPISFSDDLSPFEFTEKLIIDNKSITISTYSNKFINIYFSDIEMIGYASLSDSSFYDKYRLYVNNLIIQKGISNINNIFVKDAITLNPGSTLNIDQYCTIGSDLETINLEWDLNQPCLLNSSNLLNLNPKVINIIYKGSSIRKRKLLFDEFLENGTVIMINVDQSILNNIHFIAENDKEFNDGEDLALECQVVNENEIHLFTTRQLYNESEVFETDSPSQSPTASTTPSFSPEPTYSPSFSPEETPEPSESPSPAETNTPSKIITNTNDVYEPTNTPDDEPAKPVVDSYESTSETIIFEENGFYDDTKFVPVEENKINLIKSEKHELTLKTSKTETNQLMFVSPQVSNAVISISASSDDEGDFGGGEFGVHANSKNPTINLPQNNVPLNIFNDEESEINLVLNQKDSKLLETSTFSFEKLTISDGKLKIKVNEYSDVEFDKVETFLTSNLCSYHEENSVETKIKSLTMNSKSSIVIMNANFNDAVIKSNENTKIEIQKSVKFNEKTSIEVTDSSLIDFGESIIDGIPNKITVDNKLNSKKDVNLICGVRFDCSSWKEKYEENSFYKYSKCTNHNNEKCLTVSSINDKQASESKKPLSGGAIAGIVIAVIVVVAAAVAGFIIWKKKKDYEKSDDEIQENYSPDDKQL